MACIDRDIIIYHTETKKDYDALIDDLDKKGYMWQSFMPLKIRDYWGVYQEKTCIGVRNEGKNVFCSSFSTLIHSYEICKYEAKEDEKMRFTKENIYKLFTQYRKDSNYSLNDLQDEILDLDDTPEKVVVPKFAAEWIQSYLNEGGTPIDVLGSLMSFHASFVDESVIRWFKKNSETMLKALTNGYTIEPEQFYYIPLPDLKTLDGIQQVLSRSKNKNRYFASRPDKNVKQRYTKEELEQVPEVYKLYAKPIEEEEE